MHGRKHSIQCSTGLGIDEASRWHFVTARWTGEVLPLGEEEWVDR
jgi:hypothetical protein